MHPDDLLKLDRTHVWHPYAPIPASTTPLLIDSASGVHLHLTDGRHLIDGMSSWWAAIHGYRHPTLDAAAHTQLNRMSHVMFGGLTHEPAITLAKRLVDLTPQPLQHVFLTDSGSVSIEVAIKMSLQYWRSTNHPTKRRLLTWRGGYHGDTFHPMSVCDPDGGMHSLWRGILPTQIFADTPPPTFQPKYQDHLKTLIEQHADETAAVIVEPVVQGAGGMRFHDPAYLTVLRELTEKHHIHLIFDEIATGFGRTGTLFAANQADVAPDIMCVGKALTGGYLTMAAALCTTDIADGISQGELPVLAHGPTFMGNPLSAAIANASIDLLLSQNWQQTIARIETQLENNLAPARKLPGVKEVRVKGAIGVVQLDHEVDMAAATEAAIREGAWLRPFRDLIYTMPPYIGTDDHIATICAAITSAAQKG